MPLSKKLTATEFTTVPEDQKGAYRAMPDGSYEIDLPVGLYLDDQNPTALRNALQRERQEKAALQTKVTDFEDAESQRKLDEAAGTGKKNEDLENYKLEVAKQRAEEKRKYDEDIKKRDEAACTALVKQTAATMASKLSKENAHFMEPIVAKQLKATMVDGVPTLQIMDAYGQPDPTKNLQSLENSLSTDPRNAAIIVQSNASGGGASGSHTGSAVPDMSGKTYWDFNPAELSELKNSGPEGKAAYEKLVKERGPKPAPVSSSLGVRQGRR